MKILAVHLRNLNSLAGSWTIDFTAPEYAAAGIFAITGPTGAGKSTILDAICLALFARTPRLGHISKASNEIMSRRAGDCFAEVEFETKQGRYRCHWGQHRARRSPEGDLQPPKHEIVDARSGKVLETRTKEVGRLVEQVTGMDYDRFTRSILLAQGSFAAFLEADADQRAPILEQITGTGIYSQISIAVHERTSEERQKTASLQEALGNVMLLGEEEEKSLEVRITEGLPAVAALQQALALRSEALHRIAAIEALKKQLGTTEQLQLEWGGRYEAAKEALARFERGSRAQFLLGDYTQLQHLQERVAILRASGAELRTSMERLQKEQTAVAGQHHQACQQLQQAVELQDRENELLKTVRALDLRLYANRKAVEQVVAALQQAKADHQQRVQQRAILDQKLGAMGLQQKKIEHYFQEHAADSLLVEHLAGFRRQLLQLEAMAQGLTRLHTARTEKETGLALGHGHAGRLKQAAETAGQELVGLQQGLQARQTELQLLLDGRNPSSWRLEIEQNEQRLQQLTKAGELLARQHVQGEELAVAARSLENLQGRQRQQQQELQVLEERHRLHQQLTAQLEANYQLIQRIHSYEEERRRLVDGDPCPLCGATHHPWGDQRPVAGESATALASAKTEQERLTAAVSVARESLVALGKDIEYTGATLGKGQRQLAELEQQLAPLLVLLAVDQAGDRPGQIARQLDQGRAMLEVLRRRIKAVEQLQAQIDGERTRSEQALALQAALVQQVQAARHVVETTENELRQLEQQHQEILAQIDQCRTELHQQLQPLGIPAPQPDQAEQLLAELLGRQLAWKGQLQQREQLARDQAALQGERDKAVLLLTTIDQTLDRLLTEQSNLRREGGVLQEERVRLYGDRHPDQEEQRLKALVQQAEAQEVKVRNRLADIDKTLHGFAEQQRVGAAEQEMLLPQIRQQETELLSKLPLVGFADTAAFCSALLPPEELAELASLQQQLDKEQTVLATRKAEQTAALQREEEQHRGQKAAGELLEEQKALNLELEALQQRIGADRERLAANELRKKGFEEQRGTLALQQKEQERWELLHQLIGSADGKKFRVFAQGLTFDLMISHANRQLRKMNDRYILLRDLKDPLALQVIDNYQAGEVRSTRNLSGGESFLVSLALSLGLSAMASHNVRVDSLFLDEGFGTLDEEALQTALQTLAELQHDGKLIGIISHVPLLKDRIDVRIQVLPGPGGRSRLIGPGCRQSP
jgi:exonuclease SbcC